MYGDNDLYQFNNMNRVKAICVLSVFHLYRNFTVRNAKCLRRLVVTNGVAALERHMIIESHDFVLAKMTIDIS